MESVSGAETERATRWADPTIKGRDEVLDELQEFAATPDGIPRLMVLEGRRGAGTSALTGEFVGMVRGRLNGLSPMVIRVDVSAVRIQAGYPTHGVVVASMQHFMPGETFAGSSTGRVMVWFLRRIIAEGRPVVVWLDQVRPNVRTLDGVLGSLLGNAPGLPPVFLALSGNGDRGVDGSVK